MNRSCRSALAIIAAGMLFLAWARATQDSKSAGATTALADQATAAEEVLRSVSTEAGRQSDEIHAWSTRVLDLEVQIEASDEKAALERHRDRMIAHEKWLESQVKTRNVVSKEILKAHYYRLEAEAWVGGQKRQ